MIRGLDHFSEYFKELKDHFVVVGGTAATLLLEHIGITFRATKDIDIVIITNDTGEFADKLADYVKLGQYEIQSNEGRPRFYRFLKPSNLDFPFQIELFYKRPEGLELFGKQHIIPIKAASNDLGISAILLESEYFEFIRNNVRQMKGVPTATIEATIILKARAFCDLVSRKSQGDEVDSRDILKHKKDIFRLAQALLRPDSRVKLDGVLRTDFEEFIRAMEADASLTDTFRNLKLAQKPAEMIELLKKHFLD